MSTTCLIIPAAGRGTRLGLEVPKVFCDLGNNITPLQLIINNTDFFNHDTCLILSPQGKDYYDKLNNFNLHVEIQQEPKGMGDAIFSGYEFWKKYDNIIVIWGDQCSVNYHTIYQTIEKFNFVRSPNKIVVPLVQRKNPYVDYVISDNKLVSINQSRENEICRKQGLSDVGVFMLSTQNIFEYWQQYLKNISLGSITKEINFLPFIYYLSHKCNYIFSYIEISDKNQVRGLNTKDDLLYFSKNI